MLIYAFLLIGFYSNDIQIRNIELAFHNYRAFLPAWFFWVAQNKGQKTRKAGLLFEIVKEHRFYSDSCSCMLYLPKPRLVLLPM